jgi:hypothetical protein
MKVYAKLGWLEVITTQQFLTSLYKKRLKIENISERDIPRFTSKKQMIAYQAFADACSYYNLVDIDYMKIKKLEASVKNSIWEFKYKIKTGWLFCDYCKLEYDEDWEIKLKEQELKEKENEKRRRKILRGR